MAVDVAIPSGRARPLRLRAPPTRLLLAAIFVSSASAELTPSPEQEPAVQLFQVRANYLGRDKGKNPSPGRTNKSGSQKPKIAATSVEATSVDTDQDKYQPQSSRRERLRSALDKVQTWMGLSYSSETDGATFDADPASVGAACGALVVVFCWCIGFAGIVSWMIWSGRDLPAETREHGGRCVRRTTSCGTTIVGGVFGATTAVVGTVLAVPGTVAEVATGSTSSSTRRWVQI